MRRHIILLHACTYIFFVSSINAASPIAYANDFIDPNDILTNALGDHTYRARESIVEWANSLAAGGPWSVMNKTVSPPSSDKHDYMSWAPYWWPDCSGVGNTTVLTPEQIWKTCHYVVRDGQFNPDARLVNDVGAFQDLAEAVLYNAIAWTFNTTRKNVYEADTVRFIRTWFLDEATRMNPHLIYGQMQRGPDRNIGSHTGLLDLKAMAKVTSAILLLRQGKSTAWTKDLDDKMISWSNEYITWMETADIAIMEAAAANNHGTFYYNQLAALKVLVNDLPGAKKVTDDYFNSQYLTQIEANGEQPLEAARTRPYHYRSYNIAAMITNGRISKYADPTSNPWNKTTNTGATIKSALDFAMTIPASTKHEEKYEQELYPNVAAVAAIYGDKNGTYLAFVKKTRPGFMRDPYILWNQPWGMNEFSGKSPTSSTRRSTATGSPTQNTRTGGAISIVGDSIWNMVVACAVTLGFALRL
ncbi:chondroitin AC/alginate lyase [Phlegmacium glaucopus]|nr:chondroitin AC/alginate lyase [Phlegmacium glaucopus]